MTSQSLLRRRNVDVRRDSRAQASASNGVLGTKYVLPTHSVPIVTETEVAQGLASALADVSAKEVARDTHSSLDTAKAWKAGDRCAHTANTINMARSFPPVNEWLAEQCGWSVAARAASKDEVIRWASQNYSAPGQDGAIARAVLREAASQHT